MRKTVTAATSTPGSERAGSTPDAPAADRAARGPATDVAPTATAPTDAAPPDVAHTDADATTSSTTVTDVPARDADAPVTTAGATGTASAGATAEARTEGTADPAPETAAPTAGASGPGNPSLRALRYAFRHVVLPLALTVVLAVVLARGIEMVHVQTEPWMEPDERWATLPPRLFLIGAFVVWPFVALLLAVTGSLWATALLSLAAGALIALSDHQKMAERGEPLFPSDIEYLSHPGLLLATAGISPAVATGAVLLLVAALALIAVLSWRRRHRRSRTERWVRWGARAVFAVAGVVGIAVVGDFHEPGNPVQEAYDEIPVTWAQWNQVQNYAQNGFIAGALYNLPGEAMERPEGYGAERMAEVVATYSQAAAEANATRTAGALEDTNVVVVLGETFTDPTRLAGVEVAEDPIPFTRSLMGTTPSGTMLSSGFGGGTANVEFEVLTGMALANFQPQMHAPYPMLVPHYDAFPTLVDRLGAGKSTLAIHPYAPSFYRRDVVYPILGFERQTFWDTIGHRDKIENDTHISDAATYAEVVDELRAADAPLIVNVVTMQNHSPYAGNFSDPIGVSGDVGSGGAEQVGQYLRGLRHSDDAMAQLVSDLEALDERTIVLFYGDHLPAMWPAAVQDANTPQALHETPWFVWANFGTTDVEAPPVLGPNHLVGQLLDAADAPLTPFDALLAELSREVAADEAGTMLDARGRPTTEAELSPRAQELLADYRLVQYDMSVGQRHSLEAMTTVP
ncbi:LTA synthase family protein [Georgenia wangjunii]|uniref:LTA synthase family protein n=1 Tax=Georgenia wangjunii TaxID=3117730 RepID=UPI002F26B5B9